MILLRTVGAALLLFPFCASLSAQQWQLVTPIKTRSELVDLKMTGSLTGYAVDRPMKSILKTSNAGADWERKANNLSYTPNALWMWDEDHGIVAANSGRFYHTEDGFNTITTTSVFGAGHASSIYFVNDTLGFTGTEFGQIFRTTDGGATWLEQVEESTGQVFCFFFVDELLGFASAGADLYRTTDGGIVWEPLPTPELVNVRAMHFFDAQHGIGVGSVGLIIRTDDGGDTWVVQDSPTTYTMEDLHVQGDVLFACGAWGHMIRSTDGGDTWAEWTDDGHERFTVDFNGAGIGLMTGSGGYIYRSMDLGATWEVVYRGTPHTMLNKVSFADNGIGVTVGSAALGGMDPGFIRSTDGGRHWNGTATGGGLGIHLRNDGAGAVGASHTADFFETIQPGSTAPQVAIRCVHAFTPSTYIVAGGNLWGGFYRTTNGGGAWAYTEAGNPYDMYFPTETMGYAAGEGNSVYKTTDAGVTWTDLGPQVPAQQFTVFFHDELRGWTGGAGAGSRTTDGGLTWETMGSIPSYTKSIIFTDADTGYAMGQSGQTLRSTDGGITWVHLIDEVFNATMGDAALVDGALIAVGNAGDIYRAQLHCPLNAVVPQVLQVAGELCTAEATTIQWYVDDEPVPGGDTPCITPAVSGSYHVVVTDVLGCVSAASNSIDVIVTGLAERTTDRDIRIQPNPASTSVTLTLPHALANAHVEVVDMQGRTVSASSYTGSALTMDIALLPAGIYIVRCVTGDAVLTGRFVKE